MRSGVSTGLVGDAHDQRRAAAIDHRVRQLRRDDFAAQPVMFQRIGKVLRDQRREIAKDFAREIGIVRHRRRQQVVVQRELGVGEQHRKFRPRQRLRTAAAFADLDVVGQELHRAIELAARFQRLHQPLLEAEIVHAMTFGERDRQRLLVVVAQHEMADILGHFGQQLVAILASQAAVALRAGSARS